MRFKRTTVVITCASAMVAAVPALAWNNLGHHTIALIAYQRLTPMAKAKLDAILAADPDHRTLLDASVWPDIHRTHPTWHYVNIPVRDGTPANRIPAGENVISAIELAREELRSTSATPEEKADALSNLIHFVGDIHQPLHTVARFSTQNPAGDRGGNLFFIRGRWKNLHSLWDNALNLSGIKPDGETLAADLVKEWPSSRLVKELEKKAPADWAREGYDLAVSSVYTLADDGELRPLPDRRYTDNARKVAEARIVLAGYRLSAILNEELK